MTPSLPSPDPSEVRPASRPRSHAWTSHGTRIIHVAGVLACLSISVVAASWGRPLVRSARSEARSEKSGERLTESIDEASARVAELRDRLAEREREATGPGATLAPPTAIHHAMLGLLEQIDRAGLEVLEARAGELEPSGNHALVPIHLRLRSPFPAFVQFLAELARREPLMRVRTFDIQADPDPFAAGCAVWLDLAWIAEPPATADPAID